MAEDLPWVWLCDRLRDEIVSGRWQPGERLPARNDLVVQWRCGHHTLQRAMTQLQAEGFLDMVPRQGTFVCRQLPHQKRYAVFFDADPAAAGSDKYPWVEFFTSIQESLLAYASVHDVSFEFHYGITDAEEHFTPLLRALSKRQLAGALTPLDLQYMPHLRQQLGSLPLVSVCGDEERGRGDRQQHIRFGRQRLLTTAFTGLRQRACRQLRVLDLLCDDSISRRQHIRSVAAQHGYALRDEDIMLLPLGHPYEQEIATRLLLTGLHACPGAALLVLNDNLAAGSCAGVTACRDQLHADFTCAMHCNFPHQSVLPIPTIRFGPDLSQFAPAALELLNGNQKLVDIPMRLEAVA